MVAVVLSIALTIYRGFRWSLKELVMDLDEREGAFKVITEEGNFKRAQGALILELGGIVSFVNFESVVKKLNKRVEALYPEDRQVSGFHTEIIKMIISDSDQSRCFNLNRKF